MLALAEVGVLVKLADMPRVAALVTAAVAVVEQQPTPSREVDALTEALLGLGVPLRRTVISTLGGH